MRIPHSHTDVTHTPPLRGGRARVCHASLGRRPVDSVSMPHDNSQMLDDDDAEIAPLMAEIERLKQIVGETADGGSLPHER